jgi:molecular chaperone GrpE (heat shock protein)
LDEDTIQETTVEPTAEPATATATPPDGRSELAEKDKRIADIEGQLKRLAADFENFRRRQATEREELVKFAASRVFENLMPVVDNFERALTSSKTATEVSGVLSGVEMIYRQLQDFLNKSGVAAMEPVGKPFDPNLHEAIAQLETDQAPDQTVLAEIQKGYFLNGKVLRHAMVQVANNPHGSEVASDSTPEDTPAEAATAPSAADSDKEDTHE